jgi:hypothetical protein
MLVASLFVNIGDLEYPQARLLAPYLFMNREAAPNVFGGRTSSIFMVVLSGSPSDDDQ